MVGFMALSASEKTIAENARNIREKRKFSQASVAEKMGTTPSALSSMELGKRRFSVDNLIRFCRAVSCNIGDVFCGVIEDGYLEDYEWRVIAMLRDIKHPELRAIAIQQLKVFSKIGG